MNSSKLEKRYVTLKRLCRLGLTGFDLADIPQQGDIDFRIGSPQFLAFWQKSLTKKDKKLLLKILVDLIEMPLELSGDITETKSLLMAFHPDLAPDNDFWSQLAQLVNDAFPERSLGREGDLERRLHQLRYLISSQQAQYIRQHYQLNGESDKKALTNFLRHKKGPTFWRKSSVDYTLSESARLHNKLKYEEDRVVFPDNQISYNIKLLMGFHTEFILDSQGQFLNELDAEKISENGIVNGASFNYGTAGKRHWDLDVDPIRKHDPKFRREVSRGYRSPKKAVKKWLQNEMDDFQESYFNRKGIYGHSGRSSYGHVKKQSRRLKWRIRLAKLFGFQK